MYMMCVTEYEFHPYDYLCQLTFHYSQLFCSPFHLLYCLHSLYLNENLNQLDR